MSWYFQPCQPEHQFFSELDLTTGNGTKITLQFYATQTTCAIFWGNIWILRFFSHDMQNDCCKQKKAQEKEQMLSFLYEIQFLSKDLHLVFSSLLYILFYPDKYNWNKWRQFIRKLAKNLQSLLMKLLKAISISVFIQIVLLHVSLNFFLNNFLNFFVSFYTILQETFHNGNCWLL